MILAAFPDCAPYAGKHRKQTPHLSVGSRLTRDVADALAAEVVPLLPLSRPHRRPVADVRDR